MKQKEPKMKYCQRRLASVAKKGEDGGGANLRCHSREAQQ